MIDALSKMASGAFTVMRAEWVTCALIIIIGLLSGLASHDDKHVTAAFLGLCCGLLVANLTDALIDHSEEQEEQ